MDLGPLDHLTHRCRVKRISKLQDTEQFTLDVHAEVNITVVDDPAE